MSLLTDIILISTPYLPCKKQVVTANTGTILIFPWIQPFGCVRGVSWSEVATVPKRKSHRGLDLDLSLNSEVNNRKGWKENGGTK